MTTFATKHISNPTSQFDGDFPQLFSEKRAAESLGVSVSYLRKSRCEGTRKGKTPAPPFVRVDGRVYYRRSDLSTWLADLTARYAI